MPNGYVSATDGTTSVNLNPIPEYHTSVSCPVDQGNEDSSGYHSIAGSQSSDNSGGIKYMHPDLKIKIGQPCDKSEGVGYITGDRSPTGYQRISTEEFFNDN